VRDIFPQRPRAKVGAIEAFVRAHDGPGSASDAQAAVRHLWDACRQFHAVNLPAGYWNPCFVSPMLGGLTLPGEIVQKWQDLMPKWQNWSMNCRRAFPARKLRRRRVDISPAPPRPLLSARPVWGSRPLAAPRPRLSAAAFPRPPEGTWG
jgi:hypothetical protein